MWLFLIIKSELSAHQNFFLVFQRVLWWSRRCVHYESLSFCQLKCSTFLFRKIPKNPEGILLNPLLFSDYYWSDTDSFLEKFSSTNIYISQPLTNYWSLNLNCIALNPELGFKGHVDGHRLLIDKCVNREPKDKRKTLEELKLVCKGC